MWPVEQLIKGHSALAAKLVRFAFPEAARLVAALAVSSDVHANALRVNVLAHLVAGICRGKATPSGRHLVEWCRYLNASGLRTHEDPIEDAFIGCVNSRSGSFRIFVGNTSDGDFWVERLLAFIEGKREFPTFEETYWNAIALLRLSDMVAGRLDLIRYQSGGGEAAGRIRVPAWGEIAAGLTAVDFSAEDLQRLEIPLEALTPFLLGDDHRAKLAQGTMGNSELERRPLLKTHMGISLIAPMFVAQSVQHLILACIASSMGGWADTFFATESASSFVNEVANRLGVRAMQFDRPASPSNLPPLYPFFADFDLGKPAIFLTYCPPLTEVAADYVEAEATRWWVSTSFAGMDAEKRDLVHQIWRCLLNWTVPFSRVVGETWPTFGHESIAIQLVLLDLPGWKFDRGQLPELITAPHLEAKADRGASTLTLYISAEFLAAFAVPKNIAETEIVAAILRGAAQLQGVELVATDCAALVREIVRNDDARHFHMTAAQGIEQLLASPGHPEPLFVADEDFAAARFGVADLAGRPTSDRIEGQEACQKFLQASVEKVWERIEARLRPFHHTTVIATCCTALDEVERDRNHWDLTARSLLAMHRDTAGVHDLIHDRRGDRAKSSLGNRLLIETSQYACAGDRPLNRADHMALLADMAVLLELAHHRDAIAFGFLAGTMQ